MSMQLKQLGVFSGDGDSDVALFSFFSLVW